jgi:glycosyltransferase involved in cell wall biosynthesis
MRVAHFLLGRSNPESSNGVDKTVHFVSTSQASLGHEVAVFSMSHLPPVPVPGVEVRAFVPRRLPFRLPIGRSGRLPPRFALTLPERLVPDLLQWAPDIVHFHSVHVPEAVWLGRRLYRAGVPYCVTPHGALVFEARRRRWVRKAAFSVLFERSYLRRASFLHAVSQVEADGLMDQGHRNRVVLARNCIDPKIVPERLDRALLTRRFPQLRGRRLVLYLGRLDPRHKGIDLLLQAWSRIHVRRGMALVLVGPDWRGGRAQLHTLVRELRIADSVLFVPPVSGSEKWSVIAGADVFVHASRWEGTAFAVLEAMSVAKPVLVTEAADPDGLVSRYGAGLVVQADAGSIAIGLEEVARVEQEDLREMGIRARRLVTRKFRWEDTARTLLTAYGEAIVGPSKPCTH